MNIIHAAMAAHLAAEQRKRLFGEAPRPVAANEAPRLRRGVRFRIRRLIFRPA